MIKTTIILATSNKGKAEEFRLMFEKAGIELQVENIKTVEIQSDNLEDIAVNSCVHAYSIVRKPTFVEDAGLFIDALKGFPGPYSSYVYKTIGVEGVLKLVKGRDRGAMFMSVIAFYYPDVGVRVFKGFCKGTLANEPRGTSGFGFDPIFIPEGDDRTFAEMQQHEKNKLSHRGESARKLIEWIKQHQII